MPVFKLRIYGRLFIYAACFWMALGLLHVVSLWLEEPAARQMEFLSKQRVTLFVSAYLCWSFLTVFLYYLIETNPPSKTNIRWILNLTITAVVWLILITLINQSLSQFLWGQKLKSISFMLNSMPPFLYLFNLVKILLVYSACAGIFFYRHMHESRLELLRLEREHAQYLEKQSRFQLQSLQSQLSPHFLFNCLNTISSLARLQLQLPIWVVWCATRWRQRIKLRFTLKKKLISRKTISHYSTLALQIAFNMMWK